ncbi:MAG TPA: hypothetical protein VGJ12_00855 [Gemmatimonadaceae bacterium]|jgi:hypothetical protein
MLLRWRVLCAALIVPAIACSGKSVAERIAEHDRVRVSWEQTTRFVGAEWADGAIPDAYAARTLARAGEELRSEDQALGKEKIPDRERARLRESLGAARAFADTLGLAVRARDRETVMRLVKDSPRANADSLLRQAALW